MSDIIKKESGGIFSNSNLFEEGQRIAMALAKSDLVPQSYKGNIPNTMIALEMANRIGVSPFQVMQNLDIIHGKPSWRSTFIIAALNSCGRFKPLRFEFVGNDPKADSYGCKAYTEDFEGNKFTGPMVTWEMVKAEGWLSKAGSKWKTMPELMFQYRAASFFGRLYAPDILNGMQSVEEVKDTFSATDVEFEDITKLENLKELLAEVKHVLTDIELSDVNRIIETKESTSYNKLTSFLTSKKQ